MPQTREPQRVVLVSPMKVHSIELSRPEGISSEGAEGYTWHHVDNFDPATGNTSMELVQMKVHQATAGHSGSVNQCGFATVDPIPNVDYARNQLAVTPEFKPDVGYVQRYAVTPGTQIQWGPVGPQTFDGVTYPGGGSQIQLLVPPAERMNALTPIGDPIPIK
jgi:hypothetical protein